VTFDLEMPHFDGMEVLRQLRSHPATDKVAVVIVSVVAQDLALAADLVKGRFTKPVQFDALREKIRKIFEFSV
jgi:CheY-like chemotaxis protein